MEMDDFQFTMIIKLIVLTHYYSLSRVRTVIREVKLPQLRLASCVFQYYPPIEARHIFSKTMILRDVPFSSQISSTQLKAQRQLHPVFVDKNPLFS